MRNYHLRRNTKWCPSLNLDKLWTLVNEQTRLKYKNNPDGKAPVIDIVKAVSILIFKNNSLINYDELVNGRTEILCCMFYSDKILIN